ncbi:MAG: hypothetical protein IPN94_23085 [Sphingobacteriales bacterium]|nr:hypothetical protein [Sphingobacteriales bacterium]
MTYYSTLSNPNSPSSSSIFSVKFLLLLVLSSLLLLTNFWLFSTANPNVSKQDTVAVAKVNEVSIP